MKKQEGLTARAARASFPARAALAPHYHSRPHVEQEAREHADGPTRGRVGEDPRAAQFGRARAARARARYAGESASVLEARPRLAARSVRVHGHAEGRRSHQARAAQPGDHPDPWRLRRRRDQRHGVADEVLPLAAREREAAHSRSRGRLLVLARERRRDREAQREARHLGRQWHQRGRHDWPHPGERVGRHRHGPPRHRRERRASVRDAQPTACGRGISRPRPRGRRRRVPARGRGRGHVDARHAQQPRVRRVPRRCDDLHRARHRRRRGAVMRREPHSCVARLARARAEQEPRHPRAARLCGLVQSLA